jgi:hypothetical protein
VRKAQVTVFIMIGMILLVFAALFFYAAELVQKRSDIRVVEASSAKELVEYCLGVIAEDALIVTGRQGGFAKLPLQYFEPLNTTYLFDEGQNEVPDVPTVQQELANYIDDHIGNCVNDFAVLADKGIVVNELGQPKSSVLIAERDVQFSIDYPIEERKADIATKPEFMPVKKNVKLKEVLQLADDLVESERNNGGLFDLDAPCGLEVAHFPIDNTLITMIIDADFLIQNKPYRFVFAHRR